MDLIRWLLVAFVAQDAAGLVESAKEKFRNHDAQGAQADLSRAIELDPKRVVAYKIRSLVREALNDDEGALGDIGKALELSPQESSSYLRRANLLRKKGDTKGALADYTKSIELQPTSPQTYATRGRLREELKDIDGAISDLTRAIELGSVDSFDFQSRGNLYFYNKSLKAKGIADYERAIELDPKNPFSWFFRGAARADLEQWDKAIEDYTRAIEIDIKATAALVGRAVAKWSLGDRGGAMADLNRSVEVDPDDVSYFYRGCAYYDSGDWKRAIVDFKKARELGKAFSDSAPYRIWMCRMRLGERDVATKELKEHLAARKATDKDDFDGKIGSFLSGSLPEKDLLTVATTDSLRSKAYFAVGTVRLLAGDRAGAGDFFKKVTDLKQKLSFEYPSAQAELEAAKSKP